MISVVIRSFHNAHEQNQWEFAVSHFHLDRVYMWKVAPSDSEIRGSLRIEHLSSIAHEGRIVVMAPDIGRNVRGNINLIDYDHPEDAIYVFGSNHVNLEAEELSGLDYDKVYIPTDTRHDMYSFVAAAVTLYDRRLKTEWQTR